MGAIAGSSLLDCRPCKNLTTVTLTVNNTCNLSCPHCYLQYKQLQADDFDPTIIPLLGRSAFRHLAIVGKEPLFDRDAVRLCLDIAETCGTTGKTISMITNGLNLALAPSSLFDQMSFIDVSLDGGENSYSSYRKGSVSKLKRSLDYLVSHGTSVNALHVLNSHTLTALDDMLTVRSLAPFQRIVFSPYIKTSNHGTNAVDAVPIRRVIERLEDSAFSETEGAVLLVHREHLRTSDMAPADFLQFVKQCGLLSQLRFIEEDPVTYGVIRVTFDGMVLTPYAALHPLRYRIDNVCRVKDLADSTLEVAFTRLSGDRWPIN